MESKLVLMMKGPEGCCSGRCNFAKVRVTNVLLSLTQRSLRKIDKCFRCQMCDYSKQKADMRTCFFSLRDVCLSLFSLILAHACGGFASFGWCPQTRTDLSWFDGNGKNKFLKGNKKYTKTFFARLLFDFLLPLNCSQTINIGVDHGLTDSHFPCQNVSP